MLRQRLLSTAAIVPLWIAGMIFLPSGVVLVGLMVLSVAAIFEFYRVLDRSSIPAFRFVGAACGTLILLATYFGFRWQADGNQPAGVARAAQWETFALVCTVFILMVRQFPQKNNDKPLPTIACTLLGVLYVPFLLNFFIKLGLFAGNIGWRTPLLHHPGLYFTMYVVFVAKFTDAGAFFVGRRLGRHKLFPRLSPSKTWEGFAGGVAAGVLTSVLFLEVANTALGANAIAPIHAVILGVLLSMAGMLGDLTESLLKRAATSKDSGNVVPGIGGLLDLIDSVLFIAPVFYFYLVVVLQIHQ